MFGILAFAEGAFAELTETGSIEVSAIGAVSYTHLTLPTIIRV